MSELTLTEGATARRFMIFLGLLFAIAVGIRFAYSHDGLLADPDSWWHIKVGSDILSSGDLPVTDNYSHSFFGKPWIAKEWLSQIIIAQAYGAGGWNAVAWLTALMAAATSFVVYLGLAAYLRPHLAVMIAVCSVTLASNVFVARPHMLAMAVVVMWTALLFHAATALRPPRIAWLALLVLWANLHASFTLGMVIAGFAALHVAEKTRLTDKTLLFRWGVFALLCIPASMVHPYIYEPFRISIDMMKGNEAAEFIREWQPFNAKHEPLYEYFLLISLFAITKLRLDLSWSKTAFIYFTLHMFLTFGRFSYVFFLLVPVAIAAEMGQSYHSISVGRWALQARDRIEYFVIRRFRPLLLAAGTSCILASGYYLAVPNIEPPLHNGPVGAIAYVQSQKIAGNVLNFYNFGGPLIFSGIKTFIDGRADQIFLDGFITKVQASSELFGEEKFAELLKDYQIDWTILPPDDARVAILKKDKDWLLAYADAYAVVQIRKASLK